MGDIANKVASLRDRLAKADAADQFSKQDIKNSLREIVNTGLGDRVEGLLARVIGDIADGLKVEIKSQGQANERFAVALAEVITGKFGQVDKNISALRESIGDVGKIVKRPIDLSGIERLEGAVKSIRIPEPKDTNLEPVIDLLLSVLEQSSRDLPDNTAQFEDLKATMKKPKKWRMVVVKDDNDEITHIDAEEII